RGAPESSRRHGGATCFARSARDQRGVRAGLDWFWRGWFYTTDHVDIAIDTVRHYTLDTGDPEIDLSRRKEERESRPTTVTAERNVTLPKRVEAFPELIDFYNHYDEFDVTLQHREKYAEMLESLEEHERALLKTHRNFYVVEFENLGGLVMPLIVHIEYEGGAEETLRIPAEIWRRNPERVERLFMTHDPITRIVLDPQQETADSDVYNNEFPRRPIPSRFELFKRKKEKNPMQKAREAEEKKASARSGRF
ncbi:MAG: aminopeptidase, partial [Planctomycetota bacterium]